MSSVNPNIPPIPTTKAELRAYYLEQNWAGPVSHSEVAQTFNTSKAMAVAVHRTLAARLAASGKTLTEPSWSSGNRYDITDNRVAAAIAAIPAVTAITTHVTRVGGNVMACAGGDPLKAASIATLFSDMVLSIESLAAGLAQL